MPGFDNDTDAQPIGYLQHCSRDLLGQRLLNLQASCIHIHYSGNFGQANNLASGQVGDVTLANKRQQVVLTERVHLNIANDNHFVTVRLEDSAIDHLFESLIVSLCQKLHSLGCSLRRIL